MRYWIALSLVVSVCLCSQARSQQLFKRGDANVDANVDISDPVFVLEFLFVGGQATSCNDAANANDDGSVDLSDAVFVLAFLFQGGPPPPAPFGECGVDPTSDVLGCDSYRFCEPLPPEVDSFTFSGTNDQGYPEYTHDDTGIVFVGILENHLVQDGRGGGAGAGLQFECIPTEEFQMGSLAGESNRQVDEGPAHDVTLSPFLIAKYEVTQAEYEAVTGSNPSHFQGERVPAGTDTASLPVESVSWDELRAPDGFLARTGLQLPTEAQWEYAARGAARNGAGDLLSEAFSFGDACNAATCDPCATADDYMWWCGNSGGTTHRVGSTPSADSRNKVFTNLFGLHDMHGNVAEWCEDWYQADFYQALVDAGEPLISDPLCENPGSGHRVHRGGSWDHNAAACRSAHRANHPPDTGRVDRVYCPNSGDGLGDDRADELMDQLAEHCIFLRRALW